MVGAVLMKLEFGRSGETSMLTPDSTGRTTRIWFIHMLCLKRLNDATYVLCNQG